MASVVTERAVEPGDHVSSSTRLMTLSDLQRLEAVLHLPESQWARVKPKQQVTVSPEALPGVTVPGRVTRVSPTIDPENGTFKVTIAIGNSRNHKLRPGMFAVIRIRTAVRGRALLIPRQAVLGDEEDRFVYVVAKGRAERRKIVLGAVSGENVEVRAGLRHAHRVVVAGQHRLRPGAAVKVLKPGGRSP